MSNVSVGLSVVQNAQTVCNEGIQDLNSAAAKLQQRYLQAGDGWKDSKYAQLGGIVHECSSALRKPIEELVGCLSKLKDIEAALAEYEGTSL